MCSNICLSNLNFYFAISNQFNENSRFRWKRQFYQVLFSKKLYTKFYLVLVLYRFEKNIIPIYYQQKIIVLQLCLGTTKIDLMGIAKDLDFLTDNKIYNIGRIVDRYDLLQEYFF